MTRLFVFMLVILMASTTPAHGQTARDTQTVVFVCEHGTVKSVLAMAWFERLAREAGLPYRAISRGTAPDAALPAFMLDGLRRDGFQLAGFVPKPLSKEDIDSASVVVSLDAPDVVRLSQRPFLQWNGMPSVSANFANGRDAIKRQVEQLVDSLRHP